MNTQIVDVTVRITHYPGEMAALEEALRNKEGVISVHFHPPRLMLIGFSPERISSEEIYGTLKSKGAEAEWVVPDQL
ncbi:MAG: hypothetical protein D6819_01750 [Gammaproteobacteria bacterium]|nr:MAG: hypothetical protein D6819_01750 [Gammaproteobacteria bacterium]